MQFSEQIDKVAEALMAIQAKAPAVGKDSTGYGYTYASLPEVTKKVYPLMQDAHLSVTQILDESLSGGPAMTTLLMHDSGQWISGTYPLAEAGMKGVNSAQQFGAAITYARRYGLLAVLGIPVDDDDAACLSEKKPASKPKPAGKAKTDKERTIDEKFMAEAEATKTVEELQKVCGKWKAQAKAEGWIEGLGSFYQVRESELNQ